MPRFLEALFVVLLLWLYRINERKFKLMKAKSLGERLSGTTQCHALASFLSSHGVSVAVAALAFTASYILLIGTRWGIGGYPDSLVYIGAARSIVDGHGLSYFNDVGQFAPVTQFPPLYSAAVAAFGMAGFDPLNGARWIGAVLFAGNAILVGYIVYSVASSVGASLVATFFALTSFPMVYIHSMALSEPIFILLVLTGLFLLARHLQTPRPWLLYWSSFSIGLSCLARYVGVAFIMTGAISILYFARARGQKALLEATKFVLLSSLILMTWVFRNVLIAGNTVNRTFGFHPPGIRDLLPALDTMCLWLFPAGITDSAPWVWRFVLVLLFLLVCHLARKTGSWRSTYIQLSVFWLCGYGLFLVAAWSLNDQPLYFETRHLALPYVVAMICVVSIVSHWLNKTRLKQSWLWFSFDCVVITLSALQMVNGALWLGQSYVNGIGFAGEEWRHSQLIKFVKDNKPSTVMFSNAPDFIYTLTGNRVFMIPRKVDPGTGLPNAQYGIEMSSMQKQLRNTDGAIIYFDAANRLWFLPSKSELEKNLNLQIVETAVDGTIYRSKTFQ